MKEIPSLSKLDRFFVLAKWDEIFPFSKGESLSKLTSNHIPILFNGKPLTLDHRPFCFENMWLKFPGLWILFENG